MKKIWETGIILFSALGFWGMIYPDLCFTEDVCAIVWESTENTESAEGAEKTQGTEKTKCVEDGQKASQAKGNETGNAYDCSDGETDGRAGAGRTEDSRNAEGIRLGSEEDMFTRLCEAETGQIKWKSKFLEILKSESKGNSDGADKK